jgi:hypothetical protein
MMMGVDSDHPSPVSGRRIPCTGPGQAWRKPVGLAGSEPRIENLYGRTAAQSGHHLL